ncbi:WecB/TagA/CpsF family glycosyltransferase [Aeromicrobium sp. CF3.5]|uniref:WecB/TagA/CpsF family glycosyltransferase n=1 Tax=Aeromicrobium sp. CF3.5 TaxID=3373078 RepID=UPI003EE651BC
MITDDFIDRMADKCLRSDAELDAALCDPQPKRIQTVNLHHLALADRDPIFAATIEAADYISADGWPIVTLMRSRGVRTQRVTGSALVHRMIGSRTFAGLKVAILGADREVGDDVRGMFHDAGMLVEFRDHGRRDAWDPRGLARRLVADDVEMLLIAVTPPFGDRIGEAIRRCGYHGVIVNVGGSLNMVTGAAQMAPAWVRATRTEWLFRLLQEPRRLFRRYLIECPPVFLKHVLPTYWRRSRTVAPETLRDGFAQPHEDLSRAA